MAEERFIFTLAGYESSQPESQGVDDEYKGEVAEYADPQNSSGDSSPEEAASFDTETAREETQERIGHLKLVLQDAQVVDEDPDLTNVDPGDRVTVWDFAEQQT